MKYYVDIRTMSVVSEDHLNECLAPECYYEYTYTDSDIITEKYKVEGEKYLDYSYSLNDDKYLIAKKREKHFENNNCDLSKAILVSYTVPKRIYDEVLETHEYNN